jgi:NAD(P)-dependent dehydrogenase (short-subunit alcohol dehydrogenase family)
VNALVTGASRGLGDAIARGLPTAGDRVWLVSRSRPVSLAVDDGVERTWIQADLSRQDAAQTVSSALGGEPLDALVYNAGIWESTAFSGQYDFQTVPDLETRDILRVNLESAITLTRALLPHLAGSENAKIILIGSVNGLPNTGMPEVAYNASKWGLRGVAHGLRAHLRGKRIGVTVVNPGSIDVTDASKREDLIPPSDLVALVRCVVKLSRRSNVTEIDVPAMLDEMA